MSRGTFVRTTSIVKDFQVLNANGTPILQIGEIEAAAEAWAHGRPKTAGTMRPDPIIRNIRVNGDEKCATNCDIRSVASMINDALPGTLRISVPRPDAEAATGSPGGYEASVKRDSSEHIEDVQLNEQPDTRLELPAMVVTVFADNNRSSRLVIELAGLEAEARYGIYALANDLDSSGTETGLPATSGSLGDLGASLGGLLAPPSSPLMASAGSAPADSGARVGQSTRGPLNRLVRALRSPWELFWGANATEKLVVWGLLLSPVYLASRRALLVRRAVLVFEEKL
jgi:hypothetical protein